MRVLILAALVFVAMSAAYAATDRPAVIVFPTLKEGSGRDETDAASEAGMAILNELAKVGKLDVLPYDPDNPSIVRAILDGALTPQDLRGTESPEGIAKILRALRMDYAVDPRIASMSSDQKTGRVELQIALYSTRRQKAQILDATGELDVSRLENPSIAAQRTGKAAGQVAATEIIKAIQAMEAEAADTNIDPEAAYKTGMEHTAAGRYADAADCLTAALRVSPKNAQYRYALASAYEAAKLYTDAGMEYRRVCDLDNKNAKAWAGRGRCLLALGDSVNAIGYLNEAIKLGVDSVDIHFALGQALIAEGLVAQGELELQKAEEMAPNDLDTTLRLGESYEKANQVRRATDLYERYLAKEKNLEVETRLARLHASKGAYANAMEHYQSAVEMSGGSWKIGDIGTYGLLGQTLDGLATQIIASSDSALAGYDDDKLTRAALREKMGDLKARAEALRKSVVTFVPPDLYVSAHSHRVYAMGLLVQATMAYLDYADAEKQTQREQGLLLRNEAAAEIEAAQKKPRPADPTPPEELTGPDTTPAETE